MRKYMCTHTLPPGAFSYDQICRIADAAQHDPDVCGYRSFLNLSEGKVLCVLEAKDSEVLAAWFKKMEIPFDSIVPVEYEGERGVIQDVREPSLAGAT